MDCCSLSIFCLAHTLTFRKVKKMKQTFHWLAVLGRLGNLYADHKMKPLGINSSHPPILVHICRQPGITQDKLKTMIYIHPSNITRALDNLEKEGYIRKEALEADRLSLIHI